jgi:hypothetical protein
MFELTTDKISIWFQNRRARDKRAALLAKRQQELESGANVMNEIIPKIPKKNQTNIQAFQLIQKELQQQNWSKEKKIKKEVNPVAVNILKKNEAKKQEVIKKEVQKLNQHNKTDSSSEESSDGDGDTNLQSKIIKSNSTASFVQSNDNYNDDNRLTPSSTSSSSISSSISNTFMPNYYYQNNGFTPHLLPQVTTATPYSYHNLSTPCYPTSSQSPYYSTNTIPDSNILYPQPPSNIYSTDPSSSSSTLTTSNSFQNIFQPFKEQDYMTNPQNMYYAAAAAYYNQHYIQPTTTETE